MIKDAFNVGAYEIVEELTGQTSFIANLLWNAMNPMLLYSMEYLDFQLEVVSKYEANSQLLLFCLWFALQFIFICMLGLIFFYIFYIIRIRKQVTEFILRVPKKKARQFKN